MASFFIMPDKYEIASPGELTALLFTQPTLVPCPIRKKYVVAYGFSLIGARDLIGTRFESDFKVDIPQGYVTDLASIPRFFWSVIGPPQDPKFVKAAVIHDVLYARGEGTKEDADQLFYILLLKAGVSRWRAWSMYKAVRFGGKGNFAN